MQRGAVKSAFEFVKMLPDGVVDVRTYNLLISVCAKARDHMSALLVKEMMTKNGHQLDTVLYTNLISGLRMDLLAHLSIDSIIVCSAIYM